MGEWGNSKIHREIRSNSLFERFFFYNSLHCNSNTTTVHAAAVIERRRRCDYDARLRLACVANEWQPPVYLLGRVFSQSMCQYVCVLLAAAATVGSGCAIIMEMRLARTDLVSRAAEVMLSLVRQQGGMPPHDLVLSVVATGYHVGECDHLVFYIIVIRTFDMFMFWVPVYGVSY